MRPSITLLPGRRGWFLARVTADRSFAGRWVYLQRRSGFGQWVSIRSYALGSRSPGSSSACRRTRGTYRIFMTVNQAGAGYLAAWSGTRRSPPVRLARGFRGGVMLRTPVLRSEKELRVDARPQVRGDRRARAEARALPSSTASRARPVEAHYKLYEGYVSKRNEILGKLADVDLAAANQVYSELRALKVELSFAIGGIKNHEIYFEHLGGEGGDPTARSAS